MDYDYKVGQELYCVPVGVSKNQYSKIVKVCKRWLYLENGWKISIAKLKPLNSYGMCYRNEDEHRKAQDLHFAWINLVSAVKRQGFLAPKYTTTESIAEARHILGI